MKSRSWVACWLVVAASLASVVVAQTPDDLFRDADKYYREFTWDRAIDLFGKFLKAAPEDPRVDEAGYKQLHARVRLNRGEDGKDTPLDKQLTDFADAKRKSLWGARARFLAGARLYQTNRWGNWERIGNLYEQALRDYVAAVGGRMMTREEFKETIDWRFQIAAFYGEFWTERSRDLALEHLRKVIALGHSDETTAKGWFELGNLYRNRFGDRKKALEAYKTVFNEFADTSVADNALFHLAEQNVQEGDYALARDRFLELRRRYPKSELEKQALDRSRDIERPQINLNISRTHLPGAKIPYRLNTRNVRTVSFSAYAVDPFDVKEFAGSYLGDIEQLRRNGKLETTWTKPVQDDGKYEFHEYKLDAPLGSNGLYVIEAKATGVRENTSEVRQTALVNISSLVLVQHFAGNKLVSYVADRMTRQPVNEVQLRVMRPFNENGWRLREVKTGTTDGDGVWQAQVPPRQNNSDWQLWTVGRHKDQILLQNQGLYSWWNEPGTEFKGYLYTDRSVYRPGNTVHYKAILRQGKEGTYTNLPGRKCEVRIHDPRGKEIVKTDLTTDEFGSLGGSLVIEEKPTLGVYGIQLRLGDQHAQGSFRVEEYRKPEFRAEVGKPLAEVRAGSSAAVPITAVYYFGSPVANADVKFVVKRRTYYQWGWSPRGEWDWFYAGWEGGYRGRGMRGWPGRGAEQVVTEGTVKTDAQGKAVIEFKTLKDGNDYTYDIQAEVADVTRRVVETSGTITVTQRAFFLYGHAAQHLYKPDDKVTLTIKAQDADKQPIHTPVTADLWLMKWMPEERDEKTRQVTKQGRYERDAKVWTKSLETDKDTGERKLVFDAPKDGQYEVALSAPDKFDPQAKVEATAGFWVASDAWKGRNFDYANLQIVTEKDVFQKGQTARLLINSPERKGALLLTIGATHLYETKVIRFDQNSFVVDLPVLANYSPNVYLNAVVVGLRQVHFAQAELRVPPTDKFVNVAVQSDKAEYKPRSSGTFAVLTTDQHGKPVSAQVSVGITDDSVYAIAEDSAPNIGQFFHAQRRWNQVRVASSFEGWGEYDEEFAGRAERDRAVGWRGAGGAGGAPGAPPAPTLAAAAPEAANGGELRRASAKAAYAMDAAEKEDAKGEDKRKALDGPSGDQPVVVRSFFPDTIVWLPSVVTGADGKASVKVDFPDSLTTWRATARAVTKDTDCGQRVERVVTSKDLVCRLQAPRFFTQLDQSTVSMVVTNRTDKQQEVALDLDVQGLDLVGERKGTLVLPPRGQGRLDRVVRVTNAGNAAMTLIARGSTDSDAVKQTYTCVPHGADKFQAAAGKVSGGEARFNLKLPADRRDDATTLTFNLQPSLVNALVDALPYLVQYPYGCVEQTTSKFLPCVRVAKILQYTGKVDPASNKPKQVPEWWQGKGLAELPAMVKAGVERLSGMQNPDGSFGWFGGMRGDPWMTAYVCYGLSEAAQADFTVPADVLRKGLDFCYGNLHLLKSQLDSTAYVTWVLSGASKLHRANAVQRQNLQEAVDRVYAGRDDLNDSTRALLALTMANQGEKEKAEVLWRNLQARRIETDRGCHWGRNRWGWRWSDDQVETTSFALMAAQTIEPTSPLAEKAANWLVLNRTGNQWYSTKDTSAAILALSQYASERKELSSTYSASVAVNGQTLKGWEVTPANALSLKADLTIDPKLLRTGDNEIVVKTNGQGSPYYSAMLSYYTREDPITAASNLMSANRRYYRLTEYTDADKKRQTRRDLLKDGETIASGEQIEVEVTIEAENDFSYVAFRDPKPAGCEPVDQTSGGTWGGAWLYRELRDREVTFFADHLAQGKTTFTYRLRAESPGTFRALPHNGFAMYRPDVRCLSNEAIVKIGERIAQN